MFNPHPLLETARTLGMPATAKSLIAVASHITKNAWDSDAGPQTNPGLVLGRSSSFSSLGPTRDGREKPELSAPGELLTSALAAGSLYASDANNVQTAKGLLSTQGTSMSAPVVTGAVALMLQKKKTLNPDDVRAIFKNSCAKDLHTGAGGWNPTYGFGKLDIKKAVAST